MAKKMIASVQDLMELTDDELREVLLDETYNNANLRELIRRTLSTTKEYKTAFDYERLENARVQETLENLKFELGKL